MKRLSTNRPTASRRHRDPLHQSPHWWHRWHLSTQKFAVILTIAAFLLGLSYVWLTNRTAARGFAIDQLQRQVTALSAANEKLELQAADLRSLAAVALSSQTLNLEPADGFEYLAPTPGPVAVQP
ncbi:MAG: hypothetical protein HYY50_03425 [Candidatus Kerfeldbacteria bacterium]|nr:hypothetical protein [Candidatus Kerfeldbacteria bacterium]